MIFNLSSFSFCIQIRTFKPQFNELKNVSNKPIDIVIAWVDGEDPVLKKKRMKYLQNYQSKGVSGAAPTRFRSLKEIEYCVLSIFRFAPFVRNVFIVTDQQDPKVDAVVKDYFPDRLKDIRIVDHQEIFVDFEAFLPTFNSICISNMIWRINGLAEHFVYFNDDIFLTQPIHPTDWFEGDFPVLRGKWVASPYERLLWDWIKQKAMPKRYASLTASFQVNQWRASAMLGFKGIYFRSGHTPLALKKSTLAHYFHNHPEILKENISHRFRHYSQFNTVALANHLEIQKGNPIRRSPKALYIQPHYRKENYVARKMKLLESDSKYLFVCIQSLDLARESVQKNTFLLLDGLIKLKS